MPARPAAPSPPPAPPTAGAASVDQFEAAYRELQAVLDRLEAGGLGLDASLALYERGVALADLCERIVSAAELRVTTLAGEAADPWRSDPPSDDADEVAF